MTTSEKKPRVVAISGTSRPNNNTARALAVVTDELEKLGVQVQTFDAREMTLAFPGFPPTQDAQTLAVAMRGATGVVIATPEYHGSYCAMTKLILENLGFPSGLKGKAVALLGVAAGRIGAIKSLEHLRSVCAHMGAVVMPGAVSIAAVDRAFDAKGLVVDSGTEKALRGMAGSFSQFIHDYICPKMVLEEISRGESPTPWVTAV